MLAKRKGKRSSNLGVNGVDGNRSSNVGSHGERGLRGEVAVLIESSDGDDLPLSFTFVANRLRGIL